MIINFNMKNYINNIESFRKNDFQIEPIVSSVHINTKSYIEYNYFLSEYNLEDK